MSKLLLDTTSKHPFSIVALFDDVWNRLLDAVCARAWSPLARLAESGVITLMQRIRFGALRVLSEKHIYSFPSMDPEEGNGVSDPNAELRVTNEAFWIRLCTMGDLGFAEAYMYGDVECDDLVSLFLLFLKNRDELSNMRSPASYLFALPQKLSSYRFLNTIGNSRSNISAHYDISNDMFASFLSKDMTYSCGIYADLDADLVAQSEECNGIVEEQGLSRVSSALGTREAAQNQDALHEAQLRKLHHIIKKCKILPGHRVLEIGSGWGSMSLLIAETIPGTTIDTLTLSIQQQSLVMERVKAAGYEGRIRVHLMDYRSMPVDWEDAFDRVVSVEMIEAVGKDFLATYWKTVDWAMKKKGGVGVVQVITIPESRFDRYMAEVDFIRKWVIFPGGFLPTLTLLLQTMQKGSKGALVVDSVSNIGPHYAQTLREWRQRFLERFESHIVPALQKEYPEVMGPACGDRGRQEIEVFKRKWIYYYCYCEVGFTTRILGDHIITFTREGCEEYGCCVYE